MWGARLRRGIGPGRHLVLCFLLDARKRFGPPGISPGGPIDPLWEVDRGRLGIRLQISAKLGLTDGHGGGADDGGMGKRNRGTPRRQDRLRPPRCFGAALIAFHFPIS